MSPNILADKDVNAAVVVPANDPQASSKDVKSMEYHRQVLQNKMAQEKSKTYISPSDDIMSPCTAKLNALRNKQVGKVKPKSLFAQASAKKFEGDALFGSRTASPAKDKKAF